MLSKEIKAEIYGALNEKSGIYSGYVTSQEASGTSVYVISRKPVGDFVYGIISAVITQPDGSEKYVVTQKSDIMYEPEIRQRLNETLVDGVKVLAVCKKGRKLKELSLLNCKITLEYDDGVPADGEMKTRQLFACEEIIVSKKTKNGIQDQNIIPMIRRIEVNQRDENEIVVHALICCQNPTLNPAQMVAAITNYLPQYAPDFTKCRRMEIFTDQEKQFR